MEKHGKFEGKCELILTLTPVDMGALLRYYCWLDKSTADIFGDFHEMACNKPFRCKKGHVNKLGSSATDNKVPSLYLVKIIPEELGNVG